jgi:hypothetical protein
MPHRFDPAPVDKYADDPRAAVRKDAVRKDAVGDDSQSQLESGLEGTFPASDPVSVIQPTSLSGSSAKLSWTLAVTTAPRPPARR